MSLFDTGDLFSLPPVLPPVPVRARKSDPETSHLAAASVERVRESQKAVLRVFRMNPQPISDEQLIRQYRGMGITPHQSDSGLRTRRSELVAEGEIIDSGLRGITESGRKTILWALATSAGTAESKKAQ